MLKQYSINLKLILVSLVTLSLVILLFISGCNIVDEMNFEPFESTNTPEGLEIKNISVGDVFNINENNGEEYILLDVRTIEEFNTGHIGGAILIPVSELQSSIANLPSDKQIIVYCKSGKRSLEASEILLKAGFKEIYNMEGGIDAWREKGFPVFVNPGDDQTYLQENINSDEKFSDIDNNILKKTMKEVYDIVKSNDSDYIILDVNSSETYNEGHIPGAINIPYSELSEKFDQLDKNKTIIAYCKNINCGTSEAAAELLFKKGFTKIYIMDTGIAEWIDSGYPLIK